MSDFTFTCPHCEQPLEVSEEMKGEIITCPSCNERITIPGARPKQKQDKFVVKKRKKISRSPSSYRKPLTITPNKSTKSDSVSVGKVCFISVLIGMILLASEAQSQSKPKIKSRKTYGFKPEILQWILENNSGLKRNFIVKEDPGKEILLLNGEKVPIYQTKQFLMNNFKYKIKSEHGFSDKEEKALNRMWEKMLKMMAHPRFQRFVYRRHSYPKTGSKKRWKPRRVYRKFRKNGKGINIRKANLKDATAGKGGGNKIWINRKRPFKNNKNWLGTLFHELTHCLGYRHPSKIPYPFGYHFRDASKKKDYWNYKTVDPNSMTIPE